jgi:hypothetical protein
LVIFVHEGSAVGSAACERQGNAKGMIFQKSSNMGFTQAVLVPYSLGVGRSSSQLVILATSADDKAEYKYFKVRFFTSSVPLEARMRARMMH